MDKKYTGKYKNKNLNIYKIVIICAIILTLMVGGLWWFGQKPKPVPVAKKTDTPVKKEEPLPEPEKKIPETAEPQPVIDYNTIEATPESKDLMEKRKEEYGIDKGVDMIVRPDESVKIGDQTISMQEILDKIRLKEGELVEKDISDKRMLPDVDEKSLMDKLKDSEKRFSELEALINHPESDKDQETYEKHRREYADLGKIINGYRAYKQIDEAIKNNEELLKNEASIKEKLRGDINDLEQRKHALENNLTAFVSNLQLGNDKKFPAEASLADKLKIAEERFLELEKQLTDTELGSELNKDEKYRQEYAALSKIISDYKDYKALAEEIEDKNDLLNTDDKDIKEKIQNQINTLRLYRNTLENELNLRVTPDEKVELYGIYVVQPGDNIWNIHFQFLKECFENRAVTLSSSADEPDERGKSSGVGKILKFSENMVYIYNLRERKLDVDLNLIHPLSKIVVFNLKQALSLLEQIDYKNINRIRYDGETLWIPADQEGAN